MICEELVEQFLICDLCRIILNSNCLGMAITIANSFIGWIWIGASSVPNSCFNYARYLIKSCLRSPKSAHCKGCHLGGARWTDSGNCLLRDKLLAIEGRSCNITCVVYTSPSCHHIASLISNAQWSCNKSTRHHAQAWPLACCGNGSSSSYWAP